MEQTIKIIKLKTENKKQLYKDILSSSKKVQDIIKKTKINKSKFYKTRTPRVERVDPIKALEQIVYNKTNNICHPPIVERVDPIKALEQITNNISHQTPVPVPVPVAVAAPPYPVVNKPKKTCINNNYFKHEEKIILEKKTLKKNLVGNYKSKKLYNYKPNNVLNYYNTSKKITMKIFTQKEIDKFINVLTYYSDYGQFVKIHKYLKKLNKYQTLQILYDLNLIKSKSKAPLSILKNILYNYFCCNINIIR